MTRSNSHSGKRKRRCNYRMVHGDARVEVRRLKVDSIDSVVCDPPFELRRQGRSKGGYLNQAWDQSGVAFDIGFWGDVVRVMKPGAHLVSFGSEKTIHRVMIALEDAGLEIRHLGTWVDANAMPWSKSPVKLGAPDVWSGWGTALKAATPWVLCRKPVEGSLVGNLATWGVGALNVDACRHPAALEGADARFPAATMCSDEEVDGPAVGVHVLGSGLTSDFKRAVPGARKLKRGGMGYGSTAEGNVAEVRGDGAVALDGVMGVYTRFHRIPACEDTTLAAVPAELLTRALPTVVACPRASVRETGLDGALRSRIPAKPLALMRHLVRLVTPHGGLVLDPFAGTGTTGIAALWEGMRFIGIEQSNTEELPLVDVARARLRRARTTRAPALVPRAGAPRVGARQ